MLSRPKSSLRLNRPAWQSVPGLRALFCVHWDHTLFLLIGLLLAMSFGLLYSASGQKTTILLRHGIHLAFSFGIFVAVAQFSPKTFKQWAPILYAGGILMLLVVLILGTSSKGAQRWVNLGGFRFQPSEFMKLITPLMLAYYLDNKTIPLNTRTLITSLAIVLVPGLLIIKQPDLGTGLLVIATGFGVLFFAGIRWSFILKLGAAALATLPILWWKLHDYQRERVLTFLNPERDPLGSGYHIIQSKIAIGSGGLYGKGWCQGTQSQLNFLPERTTDFIFSVLGEEFGFVGASILCALYFAVILRGIVIMTQNPDTFNRLMVGGIIFGFFICFFINIGMVSGLLPVVGCPLPLISYGGTSLVTWMTAFGMLVAIQSQQKNLPR
ncbi:rod shape-determining protein RodA [Candidatus Berkiella aquae]|uniref:Peptidoglycan glycosyltransferase MrdB n=1 Tax=Candidatus Berkiella aquae TaxID=295108 RepID=A0A0Q9YVI1_9GAMM|nr:rod shape-determining protein RodA [Candidatus Berkiella aquae]MCS5710577.1 rod shape-determining protein RodA [Candidatus Berkiella aquae]